MSTIQIRKSGRIYSQYPLGEGEKRPPIRIETVLKILPLAPDPNSQVLPNLHPSFIIPVSSPPPLASGQLGLNSYFNENAASQ